MAKKKNSKNLHQRIIKHWKRFQNKHGNPPQKIYLTLDDEYDVLEMLFSFDEKLGGKAFKEGIRTTVPKILGLQVVYDADKFKLE
jgi:hypothetical protein